MSTYSKVTRHPQTGKWELATWHDDYFGHHEYGVEFPSDKKVYPVDIVQPKQIKHYWADDVRAALQEIYHDYGIAAGMSFQLFEVEFLDEIENAYKIRWKKTQLTATKLTCHVKAVSIIESQWVL